MRIFLDLKLLLPFISIFIIGAFAGYFLPEKVIKWQVEKQTLDYFVKNDVSLPFQTFTTFTYENIIANAAPWAKKYLDDSIVTNIEKAVRDKYSYRFDSAISNLNSENEVIDYMTKTGLIKELALSEEEALQKLQKLVVVSNTLAPKKSYTKVYMNESPNALVRLPAEFEPIQSVFVSFPIYFPSQWKTHLELISGISKTAETVVLVPNIYWQKAVMLYMMQKGVLNEHVRFAYVKSDDVWTRDYGPTTVIKNDGSKSFIWNNYYEKYTSYAKLSADAAGELGRYYDVPVYRVPLVVEGGNIITDGNGTIIMFDSVLKNNPDYNLKKLKTVMKDYYGCTNLILLPALDGELTGHIDMIVKYVDKETLMVIESDKTYRWYQDFENIANILSNTKAVTGRSYKIIRVKMPNTDNKSVNFWSYINSLTVNGSVIVPTFGVKEDNTALEVYKNAMPGYSIIGINFSNYPVGSIHCQTKEMYK